nr:MAG TPA: hypothetical protein [Caudoviricetes sp.]
MTLLGLPLLFLLLSSFPHIKLLQTRRLTPHHCPSRQNQQLVIL